MKKRGISLFVVASALVFLAGCQNKDASNSFASVNGVLIPDKDYNVEMDVFKANLASQYGLGKIISQKLVQSEVLRQDLLKNKVDIPKDSAEKDLKELIEKNGGQEKFDKYLKEIGIDKEKFLETIAHDSIAKIHREWFTKNHKPSKEEMQKYFDAHKESLIKIDTKHILVKTEEEAKNVLEQLKKGADFAKLAKQVSVDPGTKDKGGELGEVEAATFDPTYTQAALALKPGEFSQPVKTQFGWHIIVLNSKKDTVDQLSKEISTALTEEQYSAYVNKLVKDADIDIFKGPAATKKKVTPKKEQGSSAAQSVDSSVKEESQQSGK